MSKTGYNSPDGSEQSPEDQGDDQYTVSLKTVADLGGLYAVISKNGLSIAYIPCTSQEEFEWIRDRLSGTRRKS